MTRIAGDPKAQHRAQLGHGAQQFDVFRFNGTSRDERRWRVGRHNNCNYKQLALPGLAVPERPQLSSL